LKTAFGCLLVAILLGGLLSCSNNNYGYNGSAYSTSPPPLSSITFRAYVSNPVQPNTSGAGSPGINIVDASNDVLSPYRISLTSLSASVTDAGMMVLSPGRDRTLVESPSDGKMAILNNAQNNASSAVTLAGPTESFFVWTDNKTVYAAVPTAPVLGQSPGGVEIFDITSSAMSANLAIPGAHYIVPSPNGNAVLVFSDNSDSVTLITPSLIASSTQSSTQVPCTSTQAAVCVLPSTFDRPVWAVFNPSGTTAYIMNCGQQCGGTGVGACLNFTSCTTIAAVDMTKTPPAVMSSVAVPAATYGLLQGNTLFVAGTPVSPADDACAGVNTAAASCGRLTTVNVASMSAATPVVITDGYHDRMQMGANAQMFIGSRNCTNVNIAGGEIRGCLTIVNTSSGSVSASDVLAPPDNGDVTGIEPIPNRTVVYVCEGGNLRVYDTTTDQLEVFQAPATAPAIAGQAIDVKAVGF
jgi:hypothetical protein